MEEKMEAVLRQQSESASLDQRIDRMHARDRVGLIAFVIVLWCTLLFALFSIWSYVAIPQIRVILSVACGLVLIFNTAAIVAMLRHYTEDKHFIYGLDIKHLDEMRRRRA
jgi:nicotinamide riboside transporter PnuC